MTSCDIYYLFTDPILKYCHILSYWALGCQHMIFEGSQVNP